jgi:flagellar biosynthesis protein FlhF
MKLKNFRAPTMYEALEKVKRQFGHDAVIVRTRSFKTGGFLGFGQQNIIEITARKNTHAAPPQPRRTAPNRIQRAYDAANPTNRSFQTDRHILSSPNVAVETLTKSTPPVATLNEDIKHQISDLRSLVENLVKEQRQLHEPRMPEKLFDLYLDLIQREVGDEIARELIEQTQKHLAQDQLANPNLIRQRLADILNRMIPADGPIARNLDGKPRVVALIGPTGVGKTTTIAKLAANFKLRQNKSVGLITIDTYRIGAVDQLRMFAEILGVPLKVVVTPNELNEAVASACDVDYILIDTAGRSQNDQIKLRELQTFLAAANPHEVHLVLSSTAHQSNLINAAEKFNQLGVDRVIFTKLDEAVSFGVVLSVLKKLQVSLSYITTGQDVPEDIEVGNGRRLARLLLGLDSLTQQPDVCLTQVATA